MISTKNLTFYYRSDDNPVFSDISFNINVGDAVILTGPSGCGKSTLAYCLAGLYPEYSGSLSGSIFFDDQNINNLKPNKRSAVVSMLFQNPDDQFCMDTPETEILFTLENINYQGVLEQRCDELLEFVDMGEYKNKKLVHLSGGMKQKIAIASAMAASPKVLILDEPFANIDPDSTADILLKIKLLRKEHDITLIIIDHKIEHWVGIVNRSMVMNCHGEIISDEYIEQIEFCPSKKSMNIAENKSDEYAIKAKNITITYDDKNIINDVSFNIPKNIITTITGKNGSGKTSLIWAIANLLKYEGEIYTYGDVGIIFQNPDYQFLTQKVIDEITMAPDQTEESAFALLKTFSLYEKRNDSPYMLSQGEQRRLAVLAMLACKKDILLLDEPTYGQDFESTQFIMDLISQRVSQGMTAVISTHDMDIVKYYGQNLIELSEGGISERI